MMSRAPSRPPIRILLLLLLFLFDRGQFLVQGRQRLQVTIADLVEVLSAENPGERRRQLPHLTVCPARAALSSSKAMDNSRWMAAKEPSGHSASRCWVAPRSPPSPPRSSSTRGNGVGS